MCSDLSNFVANSVDIGKPVIGVHIKSVISNYGVKLADLKATVSEFLGFWHPLS